MTDERRPPQSERGDDSGDVSGVVRQPVLPGPGAVALPPAADIRHRHAEAHVSQQHREEIGGHRGAGDPGKDKQVTATRLAVPEDPVAQAVGPQLGALTADFDRAHRLNSPACASSSSDGS
jgi:hypothetical protein